MAKRRKQQAEPIRKSFLIFGGVAVGVALITFILMTFVLGGGGGGGADNSAIPSSPPAVVQTTPAPTPTPSPGIQSGGRDPFSPRG